MSSAFSLNIGVSKVDPIVYGTPCTLNSPVKDAESMYNIAVKLGYDRMVILKNNDSTKSRVEQEIRYAAAKLVEGDLFMITYSGHGTQLDDTDHDEHDNHDEAWALYDGIMVDDRLEFLWKSFAPGVQIILISDSCNSGTVIALNEESGDNIDTSYGNPTALKRISTELANRIIAKNPDRYRKEWDEIKTYRHKPIKAGVIQISACLDNQSAHDGSDYTQNSKFTKQLLRTWADGTFTGTYSELFSEIKKNPIPDQEPKFEIAGIIDPRFSNSPVFRKYC